jgi:MFS family permease
MSDWARVAALLFAVGWGANHFVPLLIVYRESLHLTSLDVAAMFGVYAIGLVPGLLLGGPLSDRRGRRLVVLPSAILALSGTVILGVAGGFPLLLLGRLVVGAGSGATFSAGTAWVQDLSKSAAEGQGARRAAVALSAGFGVGPLVAGLVAQWAPLPMRLPYVIQATVAIATTFLAWSAPGRAREQTPQAGPPSSRLPPGFFRDLVPFAPWVFGFPAIAFAVLPALIRSHLGAFAVAYAGVVTAATLLAGVVAQPFVRRIAPRLAAVWGLVFGGVGLVVGLLATALGAPLGVLLASIFLGVGYGACLIAGLRWVEITSPPATRGRVVGVFYAFTYIGFTAPFLMAALARRAGEGSGIIVAAAVVAVTALYTRRRRWACETPR